MNVGSQVDGTSSKQVERHPACQAVRVMQCLYNSLSELSFSVVFAMLTRDASDLGFNRGWVSRDHTQYDPSVQPQQ